MAAYDPRKSRPNSEIREILEAAAASWLTLRSENNHARRIGSAQILIAHLEELCVQPEFIHDLEEGPVESALAYLPSDELVHADIRFSNKTPFEDSGPSIGNYFFYADTGNLSRLFTGKPVHPYEVRRMHSMGYYVYTLEKFYATSTPTVCHVRDTDVFRKMLGKTRPPDFDKGCLLIADPRGLRSGKKAHAILRRDNEKTAVQKADALSAVLSIRIVAARIIHRFCTH